MTNDFSGGLRGLRPPATFFATLRVALRSVKYIVTPILKSGHYNSVSIPRDVLQFCSWRNSPELLSRRDSFNHQL